jgi:RHS repeat-associated protein
VFEPESFAPVAKLSGGERYSIVTDHLGTPLTLFSDRGEAVWQMELSVYGEVRELKGWRESCPFRYPGQYEDVETGLYYNRFRYYEPGAGIYVSQDPIRLTSGECNLYSYVKDSNSWVDIYGLSGNHLHHTIPREVYNPRGGGAPLLPSHLANDPI